MYSIRSFVGGLLIAGLLSAAPVRANTSSLPGWPRELSSVKGTIIIYQPQLESFSGNILESRAAVSVKLKSHDEMVFGAIWFRSHLETDLTARTARLVRTEVTATRFPNADSAQVAKLSKYLEHEIPTWEMVLSIDEIIASLEPDGSHKNADLAGTPPVVYFRTEPSVLVIIDGNPILAPMDGFDLEYVVNSAFFMVKDKKQGYFLRGSGMWFASSDIMTGWHQTTDLPSEMTNLSQKIEAEEATQAAEQKSDAAALGLEAAVSEAAPEIIVSTVPAELVVTSGEPDFASIEGTNLLYLKNTEADVLMDIPSQQYYLLLAGRWYLAASLTTSNWSLVEFSNLPADFSLIPVDSDMATVLSSVPGTTASREAILETQIPQTAEVDRKSASCSVQYDGDPEFEICGSTEVAYAKNTDKPVLLIDRKYYCVDNAVWFISQGPVGPWTVATTVPDGVQDIPPECPVYNVKYVYIYDSTPETVYVGYTPGYYSAYVWGPCVVYGTGWYYNPWYQHSYYPYPITYGFGVHYSPYSGWGFSFGVSYGWLSVGVGWGHPAYGWGAGGYRYGYRRGYWHGYNNGYRHGYQRGAAAGYRAGRRSTPALRHNNTYRNRSNGVRRTGDVRRTHQKRPATANRRNNVYTDRKGDIYRDRNGQWEKRKNGDWDGATPRQRDGKEQDRAKPNHDKPAPARPDRAKPNPKERDQPKSNNRSNHPELDRGRSNRNRGANRQRQVPQRSRGSNRSRGAGRTRR